MFHRPLPYGLLRHLAVKPGDDSWQQRGRGACARTRLFPPRPEGALHLSLPVAGGEPGLADVTSVTARVLVPGRVARPPSRARLGPARRRHVPCATRPRGRLRRRRLTVRGLSAGRGPAGSSRRRAEGRPPARHDPAAGPGPQVTLASSARARACSLGPCCEPGGTFVRPSRFPKQLTGSTPAWFANPGGSSVSAAAPGAVVMRCPISE